MTIGNLLTETRLFMAQEILMPQDQVYIQLFIEISRPFHLSYYERLEMSLNDFGSRETDLFTSLFSVAPDSSAIEHRPTPRVRLLHPEPSANVTPANRIPDDALLTRAVPPDELDDDDLEDGEIDEEDYESDLDYKYVDHKF